MSGLGKPSSNAKAAAKILQYSLSTIDVNFIDVLAVENNDMGAIYEIFEDENNDFRFRLTTDDGATILVSEEFTSKLSCLESIRSAQTVADDDDQFETLETRDGKHYFLLVARDHQIIGSSEMYHCEGAMDDGIDAVMHCATTEQIVDRTSA